jgi:hypothetical protein
LCGFFIAEGAGRSDAEIPLNVEIDLLEGEVFDLQGKLDNMVKQEVKQYSRGVLQTHFGWIIDIWQLYNYAFSAFIFWEQESLPPAKL